MDELIRELDNIQKKIVDIGKKVSDGIYEDIQSEWAVDTGQSRNSIKNDKTGNNYKIYTDLLYSQFIDNMDPSVEYVRKPNSKYPPVGVIEEWVKRRGISGNPRQIAFLIARSIAKRGIKNKKIFYRAKIKWYKILVDNISKV